MQDLIRFAKEDSTPLENEMGAVTEDNQNFRRSKFFWKKQAVQKLEKELLELRLKYEAESVQ